MMMALAYLTARSKYVGFDIIGAGRTHLDGDVPLLAVGKRMRDRIEE